MMPFRINYLSMIFCCGVLLTSCAGTGNPALNHSVAGGLIGTAMGSGIGAAIGSSIDDGDIGESALLGGAIGLGAGAILGAAYNHYSYGAKVDANQERIDANDKEISESQQQIESLRESILDETASIDPDPARIGGRSGELYVGPTVGVGR